MTVVEIPLIALEWGVSGALIGFVLGYILSGLILFSMRR